MLLFVVMPGGRGRGRRGRGRDQGSSRHITELATAAALIAPPTLPRKSLTLSSLFSITYTITSILLNFFLLSLPMPIGRGRGRPRGSGRHNPTNVAHGATTSTPGKLN